MPVLNSPAGAILRWDGFMDVRSWNVLHVSSPNMIGEERVGVVDVAPAPILSSFLSADEYFEE